MNDQPNDEKFDVFLQREARGYNEPPASVPRDEMFAAIMKARTEDRRPKTEGRRPKTEDRGRRLLLAWVGMAATLLVGVAIGKFALGTHAAPPAAGPLASNDGATRAPAAVPTAGAAVGPQAADNVSYERAATAELSRAEALLTAYGTGSAGAGVDKHLSAWARDILTNTRLLLDSPAADDPGRRRLLQDLELVLVQMVQRAPADGADDERAQINRSLEHTHVLTRLRSALPAGPNN